MHTHSHHGVFNLHSHLRACSWRLSAVAAGSSSYSVDHLCIRSYQVCVLQNLKYTCS